MSYTHPGLLSILILLHGLLAVGYLYLVGPLAYDPSTLLLRGEPATLQDGVETVFPQVLGGFYGGVTVGLIFSLLNLMFIITKNSKNGSRTEASSSIQIATILPSMFHWSMFLLYCFDKDLASGFVNTEKVTSYDPMVLHGLLGLLSSIALASTRRSKKGLSPPNTVLNVLGRFVLLLLGFGHGIIVIGIWANTGPVSWEPAMFLVRGEPATNLPGMESAFPKVLAAAYSGFTMGCLHAATIGFTSSAVQTATIPLMLYHFAALYFHIFGESQIVNPEKMDPTENIVGHGMFGVLSMITFFLIGVAVSNNNALTARRFMSQKKRQ
jgi:hypothetical protein